MLTGPERIWCTVKRGKRDLVIIRTRALTVRDTRNERIIQVISLVLQRFVAPGRLTYLGRTVIDQLIKCDYVTDVLDLCRDLDLGECN